MNRWIALVVAVGTSVGCGKVLNSQDSMASGDGDRQDGGPAVDSGGFAPGDARASGGGPSGGSNGEGAGGGTGTGALRGSGGSGGSGEGGSGEGGSGEGGSGAGGVAGSAASEEGGTLPNDPPPGVPQELFEQPTVWIGEVEWAVTYPPSADQEAPQRVVLVLDAVNGSVTGSVTFGSGPPVTIAIGSPPPDSVDEEYLDLNVNWLYWPYDGFEYPVGPSDLRGNRLALSFVPGHLFGDWCVLQVPESGVDGFCDCRDDACGPPDHPVRRFDLVVTDDTMEGELSQPAGNWLGEPPAIRLKRVQ